ncbi:MAG: DNA translocase FtsK [Ahrensia sp.]|nr:DNA translocase FtsK [Ahrensia sp.]
MTAASTMETGDSMPAPKGTATPVMSGPRLPRFLAKPLDRLIALSLCVAAILAGISLATWTISDPSLTFANGQQADNWLGFWGASFADLSMQFFGFAAPLLVLVPLCWGILKLTNRSLGLLRRRLSFLAISLVLTATCAGCIPAPQGWPLEVGLGGVIGDAVLSVPRAFSGSYPNGWVAIVLGTLIAIPALWTALRACNLHKGIPGPAENLVEAASVADTEASFQETDDHEERRDWSEALALPIGWVLHLAYSARSALAAHRPRKSLDVQMQEPAGHQHGEPSFTAPTSEIDPNGRPANTVELELAVPMQGQPESGLTTSLADGYDKQASLQYETFEDDDCIAFDRAALEEQRLADVTSTGRPALHRAAHSEPDEPVPHTDAAQPEAAPKRVAKKVAAKTAGTAFDLPSLDLLKEHNTIIEDASLSPDMLEQNARELEGVLEDFGVKGQIIKVRPGPVVTLYELEPAPGVKSSRVIGLAEDIARSMSAIAARVAVVPGRNAIGIELPNKKRETVYLREQLSSKEFRASKGKLPMCLGKTIGGEPVIADMAKMPHLLVAGTTGSGKSVAINTMILSLLYKHSPDKCKLIMIDPKMLELSIYDGIPHLLTPVVVDPKKAVVALKWTVREMEERYKKMSKLGVRNIDGFNTRVVDAQAKGETLTRTVQTGFDRDTGEAIYEHEELDLEAMPYIVVIIDEMADLMMVAGKDIEGTVQRLAQMARAAGIHVIMATQRPSTDVITGTIKANFPTRISFQVTSKIDSRVMLGESGAEQLLGMGDMLYMAGGGRITRVHGPFVDDHEVEDIVNHLKAQGVPQYLEAVTEEDDENGGSAGDGAASAGDMANSDDPYDQAVAVVLRDRKVSTSYIQRRLSIGYNRAASLIERMEEEGLISAADHAGKREILVPDENETI